MTLKWKFLDLSGERIVSHYDGSPWTVGEWRQQQGALVACGNGFHASDGILDALGYVRGEVLARVEVDGDAIEHGDKSVHECMRIVKAYHWAKADSVALAIFAAELVIGIFENRHPGDDRPRKGIEAAKAWLADPSEENRKASSAASSAASAASAAYAAASAAYAAAASAASAAYAAAYAAYAAAYAAASSDRKTGRQELRAKVEAWLQWHVSELEVIA